MAVMKRKTRRKLSKQLSKLIRRHGAEMAMALVTGLVSALAAGEDDKPRKKHADPAIRKAPVRTIVVRKRGEGARARED